MEKFPRYTWKDWIANPKNKSLYKKDMFEGLRQFRIEYRKRN